MIRWFVLVGVLGIIVGFVYSMLFSPNRNSAYLSVPVNKEKYILILLLMPLTKTKIDIPKFKKAEMINKIFFQPNGDAKYSISLNFIYS